MAPRAPERRAQDFGVAPNVGALAAGSTLSQSHIPLWAWPGTPHAMRKVPLSGAVKRRTSLAPWGSPSDTLLVYARGMAGSPPESGTGPVPLAISALCGVPSFCSKFHTLVLPGGTVSVAPPLVNPLNSKGPETRRKVTVLVAASY